MNSSITILGGGAATREELGVLTELRLLRQRFGEYIAEVERLREELVLADDALQDADLRALYLIEQLDRRERCGVGN